MNYKILTIIAASALGAVIIAGTYEQSFLNESVLGGILKEYAEPDWSQINERDIVKNSIPIRLIDGGDENGNCNVTAEHYNQIIEHQYFVRADQLSDQLDYNAAEKTLTIPCDQLTGDTSELHIWYVIAEAQTHAEKYRYYITEWDK